MCACVACSPMELCCVCAGIPSGVTREDVGAVFEKFGVEEVRMIGDGTAFIALKDKRSVETVKLAADATNRTPLLSARLTVEPVRKGGAGAVGGAGAAK